ncbi:Collagenase-like protease, PrtC family [Halomonas shengliensis]|uniref:Ubiquinone biosynthesis protein UbiV n=1 Tax=Halomonas shengliensis TaxID=419597 RepID=A0A1H0FEK8_9GAMM|nr:U32 family peptidase [Halomonas shengliensis]SDN92991.1 Collagenase-like protease, PrtC family [Halomonas shengliensis]
MSASPTLQLSLGPVLFYWTRERYADFYREAADWPVEIVHLGESVCSRRRDMKLDDWLGIGRELTQSGKQVVLSSQTLIESEADLRDLRKLCDNGEFLVEANDQSALQRLSAAGRPFVAGAALNLYNPATLSVLTRAGMRRWQAPVEMSKDDLARLLEDCREQGIEAPCEVFAYGHLPLAWSSRCFTARRYQKPKDRCQFVCQKHPEGLALRSQEDQQVFTLNGIQTLSGACQDLRHEVRDMAGMGVGVARLSPRHEGMAEVVAAFDAARRGELPAPDPLSLVDVEICDGYWHGRPGMDHSRAAGLG